MTEKKNYKTIKTKKPKKTTVKKVEKKIEKKEKSVLEKAAILQKDIKLKNEDKMLQKVERYVDKNREKTSQEIMERKSKRPNVKYNAADLEVMISRVSAQSKPKEKVQETSKWISYIIYSIIIIAIIIFVIKHFFI